MFLADWPGGSWQDTVRLIVAVGIAYVVVLWFAVAIWAYRDIKSRTNDVTSQAIAALLVLLFNVLGLLLYLVLRPQQTLSENYERSLEAEALLHELEDQRLCPACKRRVEDDYVICPYCRVELRDLCSQCGKALSLSWSACPYCGKQRPSTSRPPVAKPPPLAKVSPASGAQASSETQQGSTPEAQPGRRPRGAPTPESAGPAKSEPLL
jgi:RNA polymerase subunit RPABC4/transcription elongation factor Spt4